MGHGSTSVRTWVGRLHATGQGGVQVNQGWRQCRKSNSTEAVWPTESDRMHRSALQKDIDAFAGKKPAAGKAAPKTMSADEKAEVAKFEAWV